MSVCITGTPTPFRTIDGTKDSPAYSFLNGTNAGMYRVSDTELAFTVKGILNFLIRTVDNAVNHIAHESGVAGSPVILRSEGGDANIGIWLRTKGNEGVRFGTFTAVPVASTGYITMRDDSGTITRLLARQ